MPIRSGFRAVFRQPALVLAEIAWRWTFGAAAWVLVVLSLRRVLAGIDVSDSEYLISRRSDVFLIADACARILYQALPGFTRAAAILVPALAIIWISAATLGRAATMKGMIECHPERGAAGAESKDPYALQTRTRAETRFGQLAFLNFLRAAFTLATLTAFFGTIILAGITFPAQGAHPQTAALIWAVMAALVAFFWSVVNWFLGLAPIWIVRDRRGAFAAISDSVTLFRRRPAAYFGAAALFGSLRTLALLAAIVVGLVAASAMDMWRLGIAVGVPTALLYFAVADFLYIARLAAFLELDQSSQPSAVSVQPLAPQPQPLPTAGA